MFCGAMKQNWNFSCMVCLDGNEVYAEKNSLPTVKLAVGLLCFFWHWKPAVFGVQYRFNQVSGNPGRKHQAHLGGS